MLENRLRKRAKHLRKWAKRVETDAFRVYDRDIPEIPLLIEIFGDAAAGALYARPYEKDEQEEAEWLRAMTEAASRALDIPADRIFLKQRKRQRGADQYERLAERGFVQTVVEGRLKFKVNLSDYLDTGLFLDHRRTRALVADEARGKRVLNLFCYTAAFSVHAAARGASEVDSVDLSNTYLDWAAENFALNGLEAVHAPPEDVAAKRALPGRFRLIRADALRFLSEASAAGIRWDLVVLDPPTFSNSKKMAGTLDVRRDYRPLIELCLSVLAPGGKLWFSTNAKGFSLDDETFTDAAVEDVGRKTLDEDFIGHAARACYTFKK